MKKQSLVKGTIILGMAGIIAKFLGLFFRWPLVMLVGDEGVGYYQMAYPLLGFFIAVASGIPIAVSKLVSECNAVNDRESSFAILKKAIIIRYCEIHLKGKNRGFFEKLLRENIKKSL